MNETLTKEIEALEEQARIFQTDLERSTDSGTKVALQAEIDNVLAKIALKKQQAEVVETEIQAAQVALIESFDQIVVEGVAYSLRDFAKNEQAAQVLSAMFQTKIGEVVQQYSIKAQSYKQENEELIDLMDEKDDLIASIRSENYRIDLIGADLQTKLENAANMIMEKDETIKRISDELKSVRDNISPSAPTQTNLTNSLSESINAFKMSLPAVHNVREKDLKTFYADLAETGETIECPKIYFKGRYREIAEDEVFQFRNQAQVEADPVVIDEVVPPSSIEAPPFQSEKNDGLELAEPDAGSEVASEASIIARIEALERAVFGQVAAA